jgi:predicted DNA-binding transcriptional regulator AlpA
MESSVLTDGSTATDLGGSRIPRHWRMKGKGPRAIRVGGRAKYRQSELEAWIEQEAQHS